MTDDETRRDERRRPTWLPAPCPGWCTRDHHENDHPDDRRHQDDGATFAAVLGRVDPTSLHTAAEATELVVQRYQEIGDEVSWLVIRETESPDGTVTLAWASVPELRRALPRDG